MLSKVLFILVLLSLAEIEAKRGGNTRGERPKNDRRPPKERPTGSEDERPTGSEDQRPTGSEDERPTGSEDGSGSNGDRPTEDNTSDVPVPNPDDGTQPPVPNPEPPTPPQPNRPQLRVKCNRKRQPRLNEPYTKRDACALTRDIEAFLVSFEEQPVCDGFFRRNPEMATWCKVIKKTADEFAAQPLQIDWCDASNTFPEVCDPAGRSFSPTVCGICTTIRDEYVGSGTCTPNWRKLTKAVVALFTPQPQCKAALQSRGKKNKRRYGYGFGFCNYVFQINGDYGCQKWTDLVASCPGGEDDPMACFATRLISTLIQTAGYTLYESEVCMKTLEDSSRILSGVVTQDGILL